MRRQRKLNAEINVVPYIDVTLVLLIIFMITTPLMNLGVDVNLPESKANTIDIDSEPVVINVTDKGDLYLSIAGEYELLDSQTLLKKLAAFVKVNPDVPIMIGADKAVSYGQVYQAMAVAQQAGAKKVGLISEPIKPD
ncbi:ExbD/TolR family protein [Marinicella gelatinilytica]|uniref:ExbD/TolR family protein n=1 Tax=Marinicella gelatinilytica TaxID=2996017 RepID=UPI002260E6CD|nr:ExbD/TolR family protein [Marinicella gelatinilytica]MCX7545372.1 ExbD/TolR family protein [Marinicella gelatinilytica]